MSELDQATGQVEGAEVEQVNGAGSHSGTAPGTDVEPEGETASEETASSAPPGDLEQEGEIAADYLEALLDIADLDGDLDLDVDGDRAVVAIVGADLGELVGPDGEVLDALQELTRLAVTRETGSRSRLMLDIDGYRGAQREALVAEAQSAIALVQGGADRAPLRSMNPFERKVVHDAVAAAGLHSDSEGEGPSRHVVVFPAK